MRNILEFIRRPWGVDIEVFIIIALIASAYLGLIGQVEVDFPRSAR